MDTSNKSIVAYDPGIITGCAELSFFDEWSFGELLREDFLNDMSPFAHYAICETSIGKDGITSAYMRGMIEGLREYHSWFEQAPTERRRFLHIACNIVRKHKRSASDHIIDACAHVLCFLYKNDRERYEEVTKGVN